MLQNRNLIRLFSFIAGIIGIQVALGAELILPSGSEPIERHSETGALALPTGTYGLVDRPNELVRGEITRQSWQIKGSSNASALMTQYIAQYKRQGFEPVYQCESLSCGGYDFRYGIETSPPPDFKVNLDAFEYVDLRKEGEIITLLASAIDQVIYLQQSYVRIFDDNQLEVALETGTTPTAQSSTSRLILESVEFASGKTSPENYEASELQSLADRLKANPGETCYIVGHSDQSGGLETNLNVTLARAQSVRTILINEFGANPNQVIAKGVAFLAPIADNATEQGRTQNRRVEAVFLSN